MPSASKDIQNNNWSTAKVDQLLKKIDSDGIIPRENPFYARNTTLRSADINFGYTEDEMFDRIRSERDIFYFAETHCNVMTDDGIRVVKMRKYQKRVLHDFDKYRFNIFLASRQIGKCVSYKTAVDTMIDGVMKRMPIFKMFFGIKKNKTLLDRLANMFYSLAYSMDQKLAN